MIFHNTRLAWLVTGQAGEACRSAFPAARLLCAAGFFRRLRLLAFQHVQRGFQPACFTGDDSPDMGNNLIFGVVAGAVAVFQMAGEGKDIFLGNKNLVPCVKAGTVRLGLG